MDASMASMEKTHGAATRWAEATRHSNQTAVDHVVGLQERNVRFAQGVVDGSIKEMRHQAESNRAVVQDLLEQAENQRDAYRALVEQSFGAYMDLAYVPFDYYKEGLAVARRVAG